MYVIKSIAIFPITYCYFQKLLVECYKITLDLRLKLLIGYYIIINLRLIIFLSK